jgi:8-oxo-dGTP pyrophosphatase MutT (NUDIX family)
MGKDIHEIQGGILKALLLKETARFSELNPGKIPTDQLTFHIKHLMEAGIIEKMPDGLYRLTITGKDYASRFDIDSGPIRVEKQAKLGVLVVVTRGRGKAREYLMQTRLKQPFFGFRGFVTGKIKWGESVIETAERELEEETGLRAVLMHKAIIHERIYSMTNELLEDKYFYIFLGQNPKGEIVTDFEGGKNDWFFEKKALAGNIFYDIEDLLKLTEGKTFVFSEKSYAVERF